MINYVSKIYIIQIYKSAVFTNAFNSLKYCRTSLSLSIYIYAILYDSIRFYPDERKPIVYC